MSPSSAPITAVASFSAAKDGDASLCLHRGTQTVQQWRSPQEEFLSLLASAAVFDLGYRCLFRVSGADQVRWLNGMITNNVRDLEPGRANYSFVLNAQGRILGDVTAYRCSDHILLATDVSQAEALSAHFDHFIIMDDVVLERIDEDTAIGVAGPQAASMLAAAGLSVPAGELSFVESEFDGQRVMVSHEHSPVVPRFAVWLPVAAAPALWEKLRVAGASAAGVLALEGLRMAEAVPQYGVDFSEKYLPQEVDVERALHFQKGCYLGQEIVERIHSRASVHRQLRLLETDAEPSALPAPITAEGKPAGEITSAARLDLPSGAKTLALGMVRNEAVARQLPLTSDAGSLRALAPDAVAGLRKTLQDLANQHTTVS